VTVVRLMGEGQYRMDDAAVAKLNELDDAAGAALERGDEEGLRTHLEELAAKVRELGEPLPDDELVPSECVVPPSDLSLEEAREFFSGDGLIPDLPVQQS
jgi:hypothetical protein